MPERNLYYKDLAEDNADALNMGRGAAERLGNTCIDKKFNKYEP